MPDEARLFHFVLRIEGTGDNRFIVAFHSRRWREAYFRLVLKLKSGLFVI